MTGTTPQKPPKPSPQADRRAKRLAEALRANLKRRKAGGRVDDTDTEGKSGPVED